MTELAMIGIVAAGTLLLRASLVALLAKAAIPERLGRALRLVAPAILGGLVAKTLLLREGSIRPFAAWYVAAAMAALVGWKTRSVPLTLLVGMATVWIAQIIAH